VGMPFSTTGTTVTVGGASHFRPPEVLAVSLLVGVRGWREGLTFADIWALVSPFVDKLGEVDPKRHVLPWPEAQSWVFYREGSMEAYCVSEETLRQVFTDWTPPVSMAA
jgi:hypothetical protein